ncbi:protein FAM83A-like [Clinocottus analis]|uniref:protein FAM83A-like n=1 Tax=Clinocottus analis TaxID=304258 RepID=UPI0035BF35C2
METSAASVLLYRWSKPRGKVRRRVLDLRIPSSCYDFMTSRPALDLSHNESARLAVDSLLSRGLQGYHEVLSAEGEVDFLSELEKTYILENGRDGNAGSDPDASDYGDKEFESLFAGSQSAKRCPAVSTDSDLTLAGLDLGCRKDVKLTDPVLDKSNVEVYLQSDTRSAVMKDLVREFIRKAGMALAIVMTSFSDVELLCDLLEASRKRNVSVHLLLDHLNLNLFVSMWQDLKLDSKSFPKLSVRSVDGQTYCAKSGRKLTGHITESFIITDWTEVLTGSYSFSWLSWQVHRSLAVLVKGSAILPFHEEFLRLNSSSKPVPSFVTFITVPHTLPLHATLHAARNGNTGASESRLSQTACHKVWTQDAPNNQTKAKNPGLTNPQSYPDARPLHRAGTGTQTHEEPLQRHPEPRVQPVEAVLTRHGAQRHVAPLEKSHSNPLRPTHASHVQSQLTSRALDATSEKNAGAHESTPQRAASPTQGRHRMVGYQSTLEANLERHNVGTEGLFFWQRSGNRLTEPSGMAAGLDARRQQRTGSFQFKPKVGFRSDYPKELPDSTTPQKQTKTGLWFPLSSQRGPASGLQTHMSSLGAMMQNQLRRRHHPSSQQANTSPEASGSKSTSSAMGAFLKPKLQSNAKLFRPGTGATLQPHTSQQGRPPPRLNWMTERRTERPRPVARQSSLSASYRTGQKTDLRPFYGRANATLGRSKSMTDRPSAGLNQNTSNI